MKTRPRQPTAVWFVLVLAVFPWILALHHLLMLPAEALRQELIAEPRWPGLLSAQILGGVAILLALVGGWFVVRQAPHLAAGVLIGLALVMAWVVRPLAWRQAPAEIFAIERGKIWVVWLGLSLLGMAGMAVVGIQARRTAPPPARSEIPH